MAHTFEDLVQLEQAAVQAHQHYLSPDVDDPDAARQAWVAAAAAFQTAVTQYAADKGESRVDVEMAVKKAVRHPEAVTS